MSDTILSLLVAISVTTLGFGLSTLDRRPLVAVAGGAIVGAGVAAMHYLGMTAVQVPAATVVGQFSAPGGDQWGALLSKGSPLTECVSQAVEKLEASGELAKITNRWMSQAAGAPELR